MDNTQRFSGLAELYAQARPAYAGELIDFLYSRQFSADSRIADIGSGTGKFARLLLDRGSTVYCVEPNSDMRAQAVRELSEYAGFRSVDGEASRTALEDASVDFVTAAQAFHWFDVPAFRRECQRILKPCGSVFLIWNVRADSGVNRAWQELLSAYCPDFKGFSAGLQKDDPRIGAFFVRGYAYKAFDNPLRYSREAFVKRCLSSSYSLRADNPAYGAYLAALEALFDRYAEKDALTVPNQSAVYFGAPA